MKKCSPEARERIERKIENCRIIAAEFEAIGDEESASIYREAIVRHEWYLSCH